MNNAWWLKENEKLNLLRIPEFYRAKSTPEHVSWAYLQKAWFSVYEESGVSIVREPDFQRYRVWTKKKQIAYIEFCLRGGTSSRLILWNHPGFSYDKLPSNANLSTQEMVLVDGLQRLTAVESFLRDEIPAFGYKLSECDGRLNMNTAYFHFQVGNLVTREDLLEWYLQINDGGVIHTAKEINRVKALLEEERKKS